MNRPSLIFDNFKLAAASAMRASESSGSATVGDSMKTFRAQTRSTPQWTAPTTTQPTLNEPNPVASQKTAPPPPVQ